MNAFAMAFPSCETIKIHHPELRSLPVHRNLLHEKTMSLYIYSTASALCSVKSRRIHDLQIFTRDS